MNSGQTDQGAGRRRFPEHAMREIVFLVTESCNLDCVYCYEDHRGGETLSADFMKAKISEAMAADDGCEELGFSFFGGEPLLEFDAIREVVEWCLAEPWATPSKSIQFMVSTNGTLLDNRMKRWFAEHRTHITLSLSMDGTKDAQDANRCNSYDTVVRHVGFFRDNWPFQPVKMTISPQTLAQAYDGVRHLHEFGLSAELDVVLEDVWGDEASERRAVRIWADQLDRLVPFYLRHPELRRPLILRRGLTDLFGLDRRKNHTYCGAGKYTTSFTADGKEYPCFRFAPICVREPLQDVFSSPDVENEHCNRCPFEMICPTCEGLNYLAKGSCFHRTTYHCRFFQVSLLASAKLLLLEHPDDLCPDCVEESKTARVQRMQRLLAIRAVHDLCSPVLQWAEA